LSYPGSKGQAGTWQRIIGQMPPHSTYVEPFFGSGQVFFRKRPAERNVIIDAEAGVIAKADDRIRVMNPRPAVRAIVGDAISELPKLALPDDAVVYCDPPYLLSTVQGRFYYDHVMTDGQHRQLLALLVRMKCLVILSGYPSEFYGAALQDWRCITFKQMTHGGLKTECLWCNFPEPTELHDWRYAGRNFRQRLSLKRLAARWLARLDAMPPLKRGYLLDAIAQRQNGH